MNRIEEALVILMEECAEVQQRASKIIRFGETDKDWRELEKELGDLGALIDILWEEDRISMDAMSEQAMKKQEKLKKWSNLY